MKLTLRISSALDNDQVLLNSYLNKENFIYFYLNFKRWNVGLTFENIGVVAALFDAIRTYFTDTLYGDFDSRKTKITLELGC